MATTKIWQKQNGNNKTQNTKQSYV